MAGLLSFRDALLPYAPAPGLSIAGRPPRPVCCQVMGKRIGSVARSGQEASMNWHGIWQSVAKRRELALALTFIGAVGWELMEFISLEGPHRAGTPLSLGLHSIQIALVVSVTWSVIRAWQERTRYESALAAMVEKVVMAQEEERRRIAYDVHDGIAQLIVSAKQHVDTCRDLSGRDEARARQELGRAAQRLGVAIVETRRVLRALGPAATDSLGLAEAMRRAVDDAAQDAGWT